uniref:Serpentine receptor class gamma n=1 Tax=Ditylenchus dipsaci TaxID=166011 RepID=A0A915D9G6_9BILA
MSNYLIYLNLCENLVSLTCQCITIPLMSHLVYCAFFKKARLQTKSVSNIMLLYLVCHTFFMIWNLPYRLYVIYYYQLVAEDPYLLFFLAISYGTYFAVSPCLIFLLTVDRIMALKVGLKWNNFVRKLYFRASIPFIFS